MAEKLMLFVMVIASVTIVLAQDLQCSPRNLECRSDRPSVSATMRQDAFVVMTNGVRLTYDISGGGLRVKSCVRMWRVGEPRLATVAITIPSRIEGFPVTCIGNGAFKNIRDLISVSIPESVTSVGDRAFYGCDVLRSVTIPSCVTNIGESAFYGCHNLVAATIPASVTSIGPGAISLTPFYKNMPDGFVILGDGVLIAYKGECPSAVIIPSNVKSIGSSVFSSNGSRFAKRGVITSVQIPSSVRSIGSHAFMNCTGLESVSIPMSVRSIGDFAFFGCSGLTSLTITNGLTSIESHAFSGCSGLTTVTIPDGVTSIGSCAFSNCSGLTSVTIPPSVTRIGWGVFSGCSRLVRVDIADLTKWCAIEFVQKNKGASRSARGLRSVRRLHPVRRLYINGKEIKALRIPEGVTSIGNNAFSLCGGLTSVVIPDGVRSIGEDAFSDCCGVESVTIPSSVAKIGSGAFLHCCGLTSVTIPRGVTSIGEDAFWGCDDLTSVTMLGERPVAPIDVFMLCRKLKVIHVPANSKSWAGMKEWQGIPLVFDAWSK